MFMEISYLFGFYKSNLKPIVNHCLIVNSYDFLLSHLISYNVPNFDSHAFLFDDLSYKNLLN